MFSVGARWRLKEVLLWVIITSKLCKKNVNKDFACDGEVFFWRLKSGKAGSRPCSQHPFQQLFVFG
jgi:hypothetical protein